MPVHNFGALKVAQNGLVRKCLNTIVCSVQELPGGAGNVALSMLLAGVVNETTYHTSCLFPGSQWFNSRTAAPVAVVGAYVCAGGAEGCDIVGLHTTGWKCLSGSVTCTDYVIGAHRAAPYDPLLTAARAATSPFEAAKGSAEAMETA